MARPKVSYVCGSCGARTPQWQGQCPACQAWNTLELAASALPILPGRGAQAARVASRTVTEVTQDDEVRAVSGIGELDRVLGGGLVAGSVILLGGDPGIVDRVVQMNDVPTTIVGVMPDGFRFPLISEVWLPLATGGVDRHDRHAAGVDAATLAVLLADVEAR